MRHDDLTMPWRVKGKRREARNKLLGCQPPEDPFSAVSIAPAKVLAVPLSETASGRMRQWGGSEELASAHRQLAKRVESLEAAAQTRSYITFLSSFAPEPVTVRSPIPILIQSEGEEFGASFFDANIHTAGETEQEVFENIRSLILDFYEQLRTAPSGSLGSDLEKTLAVLREFINE